MYVELIKIKEGRTREDLEGGNMAFYGKKAQLEVNVD